METQKIKNLLNDWSNQESKFATKWYVRDSIKFETEIIISSLCDYSDAFISITGNI